MKTRINPRIRFGFTNILLPLLLLFQSGPFLFGQTQDLNFTTLADMNLPRYAHGAATDGQYIYVTGGGSRAKTYTKTLKVYDFYKEVERYDPAKNEWTIIGNSKFERGYASAAYLNNALFLFNGSDKQSAPIKVAESMNPETGVIDKTYRNKFGSSYSGEAVWEGKMYFFGGSIGFKHYSNSLICFDPKTKQWTKLADMPEAKQTMGTVVDGILYTFGGYNGKTSSRIDAYNIETNEWTHLGNLPTGNSAGSLAAHGKKIYLVGDYKQLDFLGIFDIETGTFKPLDSNFVGRRHGAALVIGDKLYVVGGNHSTDGNYIAPTQVADLPPISKN